MVRAVAERLRQDGLKVWFDEWVLKPGDSIPVKIEEGLEHSRVLVLCMSANAFGSDWAQLEASTFRFRDPLNKERRFIPLRLDYAVHQRLPCAIPLYQLAPGRPRAGICEAPRSLLAASETKNGGKSGRAPASCAKDLPATPCGTDSKLRVQPGWKARSYWGPCFHIGSVGYRDGMPASHIPRPQSV